MNPTALTSHATLTTERLRLEPQGIQHFDGPWEALGNEEQAAHRYACNVHTGADPQLPRGTDGTP